MSTIDFARPTSAIALVLRWTARATSVASILLLGLFAFGGAEAFRPTATEAVALAFFPGGVALGMLVGWWREGLGGLITLISLGLFYAWLIALSGHAPGGPFFLIFSSPGLLFLMCWLLERARRDRAPMPA
jgi:hypothetical protein